jgi:hypothetical protein
VSSSGKLPGVSYPLRCFLVVLGICTSQKHDGKKGGKFEREGSHRSEGSRVARIALGGCWGLRVSPAPICALCVRKGCMHHHIVPGGCWGTRECPRHTHCAWWPGAGASARVPGIGTRARACALRLPGLHETSLSTQALPAVPWPCSLP